MEEKPDLILRDSKKMPASWHGIPSTIPNQTPFCDGEQQKPIYLLSHVVVIILDLFKTKETFIHVWWATERERDLCVCVHVPLVYPKCRRNVFCMENVQWLLVVAVVILWTFIVCITFITVLWIVVWCGVIVCTTCVCLSSLFPKCAACQPRIFVPKNIDKVCAIFSGKYLNFFYKCSRKFF